MFNACRRGSASISRIAWTASVFSSPAFRSSILGLTERNVPRSAVATRSLTVSADSRYNAGARTRPIPKEDEIEPSQNDGPVYTKFQDLADSGLVHPAVIREIIHGMGHETMTPVQTLTINETLKGKDTIAQARTGTGKTLGFLIPIVQNIIKNNPELGNPPARYARARASDIRAIVMSPTRELAEQIAVEARKIARSTSVKVQVAVGGNSKSAMLRQMQREGCHLLIATPGRLNDLLTDPYSKVSAPNLSAFVLDEADRLLDAGFADDIEEIVRLLPDIRQKDRQTMLFSATVPREVQGLVRRTLKPDFQFVQTIQEGEQATHEKVPQKVVDVGGVENFTPTLLELCKKEVEKRTSDSSLPPFKAIVYFTSTANVELAARIFDNLKSPSGGLFGKHPLWPAEVSQMHGRLTQMQRTRVSERFRRAKSAILFSTDVTARGMDFPNVTHVIQIGLPPSRDQYIHRVGRTGRAGKEGEGWILLSGIEMDAARRLLKGLPLVPDKSLEAATVDMTRDAQLPAELAGTLTQVADATKMVDRESKSAAYMAMIGTMQSLTQKQEMIEALNQWTRFGWGWEEPPTVPRMLAQKLGLSRLRGVNMGGDRERRDRLGGENAFGRSDKPSGNFGEADAFNSRGRFDSGRGRGGFGDRGRGSRGGFAGQDRGRGGFGGGRDRNRGFERSSF